MFFVTKLPASNATLHRTPQGDWWLLAATPDSQDLTTTERQTFLQDLRQVGRVLAAVYRPQRLNYQLQDQLGGRLGARVQPIFDEKNSR